MDLFSSHFMVVFAIWAGALSSDHSSLDDNFSFVNQANILQYSKAL